jgi:large conductance mechanosensitive channel
MDSGYDDGRWRNGTMKIPMRDLMKEFKAFAFKGNMIDLAVAVVIATAFSAVIGSLVKDVFMEGISWLSRLLGGTPGANTGYQSWAPGGIRIGAFLGELVNFLLIALVVFIVMVKVLGAFIKKPAAPATKVCPRCISDIPVAATRCKFCTSDLALK